MEYQTSNQTNFDFYTLLKPYLIRWYWFLISVSCITILGLIYIKVSIPVYSVKSGVLIKDAKKSLGGGAADMGILDGLSGFGGMSTNSIENELEIFKTKKIVRDIVIENDLQTSIYNIKGFNKKELFGDTSPIIIHVINEKKNKKFPAKPFLIHFDKNKIILESDEYDYKQDIVYNKSISLPFCNIIIIKNNRFDSEKAGNIGNELEVNFSNIESSASNIQKMIDVNLADKDATVINLTIDYPQTDKAKTIIKALIASYNKDAIVDKNSESQKTKEFIDDRIKIISRELGNVETEKEKFKTENKITDLFTETKINLESSAEAKQKQLELYSQMELTNDLISFLNKHNSHELLPVNMGLNSGESNTTISNYNKLVLERNRLLENATPQNPLIVELNAQINSMKGSVAESLYKNRTGLQLALNEYAGEQGNLDSKITKIPMQEKLFRSLERQQQIKENLYLLLLQKREETAISLAVVAPKARVVEPVYVSDLPVAPKKMLILLTCVVLGLLLPFLYIYIKEFINTKVTSKDDLKKISHIPIVAELPSIKKNMSHLVQENDFSQLAEAFRILMTNMGFMLNSTAKSNVIFVTSSVKGEGKTFVSMNLALTLSKTSKVIIIGADIRNPQLHRYDDSYKNALGLTEFLYDQNVTIDEIIFKNPINKICDIIYSGKIPPNPAELLKNGRIGKLLEDLKTKYQYIIVDTAPLLLVTDTLTIADHADLNLYVTRSEYTEKAYLNFVNECSESKKLDNVALILNDVKKENFGYGNKYGYGYNNK